MPLVIDFDRGRITPPTGADHVDREIPVTGHDASADCRHPVLIPEVHKRPTQPIPARARHAGPSPAAGHPASRGRA